MAATMMTGNRMIYGSTERPVEVPAPPTRPGGAAAAMGHEAGSCPQNRVPPAEADRHDAISRKARVMPPSSTGSGY